MSPARSANGLAWPQMAARRAPSPSRRWVRSHRCFTASRANSVSLGDRALGWGAGSQDPAFLVRTLPHTNESQDDAEAGRTFGGYRHDCRAMRPQPHSGRCRAAGGLLPGMGRRVQRNVRSIPASGITGLITGPGARRTTTGPSPSPSPTAASSLRPKLSAARLTPRWWLPTTTSAPATAITRPASIGGTTAACGPLSGSGPPSWAPT